MQYGAAGDCAEIDPVVYADEEELQKDPTPLESKFIRVCEMCFG
jgi:hypothetical protein